MNHLFSLFFDNSSPGKSKFKQQIYTSNILLYVYISLLVKFSQDIPQCPPPPFTGGSAKLVVGGGVGGGLCHEMDLLLLVQI